MDSMIADAGGRDRTIGLVSRFRRRKPPVRGVFKRFRQRQENIKALAWNPNCQGRKQTRDKG